MNTNLKYLECHNKKYPVLFSLNVMEVLQDKYGSLDAWSDELSPTDRNVNIKAVKETLCLMINEGIDYTNFLNNTDEKHIEAKVVAWIIADIGMDKALASIFGVVKNSTDDGEVKNV